MPRNLISPYIDRRSHGVTGRPPSDGDFPLGRSSITGRSWMRTHPGVRLDGLVVLFRFRVVLARLGVVVLGVCLGGWRTGRSRTVRGVGSGRAVRRRPIDPPGAVFAGESGPGPGWPTWPGAVFAGESCPGPGWPTWPGAVFAGESGPGPGWPTLPRCGVRRMIRIARSGVGLSGSGGRNGPLAVVGGLSARRQSCRRSARSRGRAGRRAVVNRRTGRRTEAAIDTQGDNIRVRLCRGRFRHRGVWWCGRRRRGVVANTARSTGGLLRCGLRSDPARLRDGQRGGSRRNDGAGVCGL